MSLTTITLTGKYLDLAGNPASGKVEFVLSVPLHDTDADAIYPAVKRIVTLDGTGAFSLELPATNDPSTDPSGLTYVVTERITGQTQRSYSIELDHATASQDLAEIAPSTATAQFSYTLVSAFTAHTAATTGVHGIADTAALETAAGAQSKADAAQTAAEAHADSAVTTHSADTTAVHGITDTSVLETISGAQAKVDAHSADTTSVHGIADTSALALRTDYYAESIIPGTAAVGTNVLPPGLRVGRATLLTDMFLRCGTPPTGAALTVQLNVNGIAAAEATIAAGASSGTASGLAVNLAPGDILTLDYTAVGSTAAGADVAVALQGSAASGTIHYVDSLSGSDSNDGLTLASPLETIAAVNALALAPGDQVRFKRGRTWSGGVIVPASGTAGLPIVFGAYGAGAKPIIDASGGQNPVLASGRAYVTLDNLDCRNGTTGTFFSGCDHIIVNECDMSGAGNDNLAFLASCSNITVTGGSYTNGVSGGGHAGIEIADGATNVVVDGVSCSGNSIGITIHNHPTTTLPTNVTIRDCTISTSYLNAFQISVDGTVDQVTNILVQNVTVDTSSGGHAFSAGIISTAHASGSIVFENCVAHGTVNGNFYNYSIDGVDDVSLIRCLSYHTGAATAERCVHVNSAKRAKVQHCTLHRPANPGGIALIWIEDTRTRGGGDATVKNCIISNGGGGLIPIEASAAFVGGGGTLAVDYNLYQQSATATDWKYNGTAMNFASWQSASGQDAHSIAGSDPLYVDPTTTFDFTLQSGSPAIDKGVVIAGVNDGTGGSTRYLGAAPDCGFAEKA